MATIGRAMMVGDAIWDTHPPRSNPHPASYLGSIIACTWLAFSPSGRAVRCASGHPHHLRGNCSLSLPPLLCAERTCDSLGGLTWLARQVYSSPSPRGVNRNTLGQADRTKAGSLCHHEAAPAVGTSPAASREACSPCFRGGGGGARGSLGTLGGAAQLELGFEPGRKLACDPSEHGGVRTGL